MSTGTTALMPLDPAVTPEAALRILPIRANMLPPEISASRNARRTRVVLIAAVLMVCLVMGGWYVLADKQRDLAAEDLASVTDQVDSVRAATHAKKYTQVTDVINESEEITTDLKSVLAKDLPWPTLLNDIRTTATKKSTTLTNVVANLSEDTTSGKAGDTVGTLQISGSAKDKVTIANFLDALAGVDGVEDVYLTAATAQNAGKWTFTLTAAIATDYECGRFSIKTCGSK